MHGRGTRFVAEAGLWLELPLRLSADLKQKYRHCALALPTCLSLRGSEAPRSWNLPALRRCSITLEEQNLRANRSETRC